MIRERRLDVRSRLSRVEAVLVAAAVAGLAIFAGFTVAVTTSSPLSLDAWAFRVAGDLRTPWLDHAVRIVTVCGLIAIVGPAVALGASALLRRGQRARAIALASGAALTWAIVWIVKAAVNRPRPPHSLVHTSGQTFPSAHAANAVGWTALALAVTVLIASRRARIAVSCAGVVLTALVGLSRIYLRAHYASDVIAAEALAVSIYASCALAAGRSPGGRRAPAITRSG